MDDRYTHRAERFASFIYADTFLATAIFFLIIALTTSMEINTTMPKPNITSISVLEGLMIPKESRIDGI